MEDRPRIFYCIFRSFLFAAIFLFFGSFLHVGALQNEKLHEHRLEIDYYIQLNYQIHNVPTIMKVESPPPARPDCNRKHGKRKAEVLPNNATKKVRKEYAALKQQFHALRETFAVLKKKDTVLQKEHDQLVKDKF